MIGGALRPWGIRRDQFVMIGGNNELEGIGQWVDGFEDVPFHIRAAYPASRSADGRSLIKSPVVFIDDLFVPGVGIQFLVLIVKLPGPLFRGFAERDASPETLVCRSGRGILHVLAADADRKVNRSRIK